MKMNRLFIFFIVAILATLITSCGNSDKTSANQNIEASINNIGELTLWSGGEMIAYFSKVKVTSSVSDVMYFEDISGCKILLRDSSGDIFTYIGNGDNWYTSPGIIMKVE